MRRPCLGIFAKAYWLRALAYRPALSRYPSSPLCVVEHSPSRETYATSAMDTLGLDSATGPRTGSGGANGAGGAEFRSPDRHGLRGLPYGVPGTHAFRAHIQGEWIHARQPQAGARHRCHQAGAVVPGNDVTAGGDGAGVADRP